MINLFLGIGIGFIIFLLASRAIMFHAMGNFIVEHVGETFYEEIDGVKYSIKIGKE